MDSHPLYLDCFQDGGKVGDHLFVNFEIAFVLIQAYNLALGTHEGRASGPLMSRDDWDQKLRQSGFSGIEICMPQVEEYARFSVVLASKSSIGFS